MEPDDRKTVLKAFLAARDGWSADRVVVDPVLNNSFLTECHCLGLTLEPVELNQALFNLRKAGHLAGLPRSKRTTFKDEDEYRFAAEVAARFCERCHSLPLDRIMAEPTIVAEFDRVAKQITAGYSELQYRWAALGLRKRRQLKPEQIGNLAPSIKVDQYLLDGVDLGQIPDQQGLYVLLSRRDQQVLYIGESERLRRRLSKHLDHSDIKSFARYIWEKGVEELVVEIHLLPPNTTSKVRRALETELIHSRRAVFNIKGA